MTFSPKAQFLKDDLAVRRHADIVANPEFQEWLQIAYAEYCVRLPPSRGAQEGMDANSRRTGGLELIDLFLNLSNQTKFTPQASDNLPHQP